MDHFNKPLQGGRLQYCRLKNTKSIMRRLFTSPALLISGLAIILSLDCPLLAQTTSDPASLSKNAFQWNQQERELGFLHMDVVFGAREVPNGSKVHQLLQGKPISAFRQGGEKEKELEDFLTRQKIQALSFCRMERSAGTLRRWVSDTGHGPRSL